MWVDWAIVLLLGVWALVEIWAFSFAGPRPLNTFLFGFVILALLWRRRAPLVVLFLDEILPGVQTNFFDTPEPASAFRFSDPSGGFLLGSCPRLEAASRRRRGAVAFAGGILIVDIPLGRHLPETTLDLWAAITDNTTITVRSVYGDQREDRRCIPGSIPSIS